MRLISCYIENFGGLSQYERTFQPDLTVIHEPNGFGKTTLAEFIRAMFYGFPRAAKTLDKNPRKKYLPWNGGVCGGNLTFELEGEIYRIQRTFGATPKSDTFSLLDLTTNKKSDRFSENIGLELFGLDGDSFERSTYLPQMRDGSVLATDSIRAKLGNLVEDTNDINRFDKAINALRAKRSGYELYRGVGGSVAEAKNKVSQLQMELDSLLADVQKVETGKRNIEAMQLQLTQTQRELEEIRQRLARATEAAARRSMVQQYNRLQDQLLKNQETLTEMACRYPNGLPDKETLERADELSRRAAVLEDRRSPLSGEEESRYAQLLPAFEAGKLEEDRLIRLQEQYNRLEQLRSRMELLQLSPEEQDVLARLEDCFPDGVPDETHLLEQQRMLILMQQEVDRRNKSGLRRFGWLIPGVAGLLAGVILVAMRQYLGAGVAAVCGLAAAYVVFLILRGHKKQTAQEDASLQARLEELYKMQKNRQDYVSLCNRMEELGRQRGQLIPELERLEQNLENELETKERWLDAIRALRSARMQILELQAQKQRDAEILEQLRQCWGELEAFSMEFAPGSTLEITRLLRKLEEDSRTLLYLKQRHGSLQEQLDAFRTEHGDLTAVQEQQPEDPDDLRQLERRAMNQVDATAQMLVLAKREQEDLYTRLERIPGLQDELAQWQQKKEEDSRKVTVLDDTMAFLQQARENLSNTYLSKIQTQFASHYAKMSGRSQDKLLVDAELEVQLERMGQARQLEFFSAGQKDLVMLCMRFALVDAMFDQVQPFVILDDPFVNLDDDRMVSAMEFLRQAAKNRQIIYLVCNRSRI